MIYFDNAATTKPSVSALNKARKFNEEMFFNPSALYRGGLSCSKEIKLAKESVLKHLCAVNCEVIFTSCGTESDNLAIFGAVKRGIFVTDKGEHSAVYNSFLHLKNCGKRVEFINLNKDGSVKTDELFEFVKCNGADFVSVSHVNNETGAINDVNFIGSCLKKINPEIIFHVDGVQAYGKLPFALSKDIDLYTISAHKINALKGTGALIKRKNINISPLIIGGGQENNLRSGTENVFGIKVFEYAGDEHYADLDKNYQNAANIKNRLCELLDKNLFEIISGQQASPYILAVSARELRGEILLHALEDSDIIIGNGSACSSKNRHSRVIEACGYDRKTLDGVLRLSFGSENTVEEAEYVAEKLNAAAQKLKGIIQ